MRVQFEFTQPFIRKKSVDKRLRKLLKEKLGETNSFICEVEITPAGFLTKALSTQMTYEWKDVESIATTAGSVDIFTRDGGGVIVRSRAFSSPAQQQQCFDLASGYLEAARAGKTTE